MKLEAATLESAGLEGVMGNATREVGAALQHLSDSLASVDPEIISRAAGSLRPERLISAGRDVGEIMPDPSLPGSHDPSSRGRG